MDITYLGHSSFKIKAKEGTIVTDPYSQRQVGLRFHKTQADVVTVSHDHFDHNSVDSVEGEPFVVSGPGEYEVKGIRIFGFPTYHDLERGAKRGKNTIYVIETEGLRVLHLGDLGHLLDESYVSGMFELEDLGEIDIMLVPVGGVFTIDHKQAAKVVSQIEPKVIIPMHYKVSGMVPTFDELSSVESFLEEMGAEETEPQDKLRVTRQSLPSEPEVIVLKHG